MGEIIDVDSRRFKFDLDSKKEASKKESVIYKDTHISKDTGLNYHYLLEIDNEKVAKDLKCTPEEAKEIIDSVVKSIWRIKTWFIGEH